MASFFLSLYVLVATLWTCFILAGTVTQVGKVYVGTPGNLATNLYFSEAYTDDAIDVFIQVEVTDGGATTFDEITNNVTLSCSLTSQWLGYSQAIFTSIDVTAPEILAPNYTSDPFQVQIPFSIIVAGRPVELRCWGESALNPGENEIQGNSTPQFTKETSISKPVIFTIRRKGTVNICYDIVIVPNKLLNNVGEFLVELSEPVEVNSNVTITCDTQSADPANPADAMVLVITPGLITEKERKIMLPYERTSGDGAIFVSCKGQSVYKIGNDSFDGDQFQNDTSRGELVPFVLDAGYIALYPGSAILQTSEMKVVRADDYKMKLFLVLDAGVTSDVTFACHAETTNSTETADDIASDPFCEAIAEDVINRPVSNSSRQSGPGRATTTTAAPAHNTTNNDIGNEIRTPPDQADNPQFNPADFIGNSTAKPYMTTAALTTEPPLTTTEDPSICYIVQQIEVNETSVIETVVNGSLVKQTVLRSRVENITKTVNCSATTQTPTSPSRNKTNGEWLIRNPTVEFKEGGPPHLPLILERESIPTVSLQEFVVVTCCAIPSTDNPKYIDTNAAVLVSASLTPNITVNWTLATVPTEETKETEIQNPAYVDVAPCPCDLTKGSCDFGCCCDTECTTADKATFDCVQGVAGGFPAPVPQYSCASRYAIREDWFPFMCVHAENTAFLGYYFFPLKSTRSELDFNEKADGVKPKYSFKSKDKRSQFPSDSSVGYQHGDNIRTGQVEKAVADNVITRDSFQLGLPQKSLLGECVTTSPVKYLENIDTQCTRTITKDLCHSTSILSSAVYAQPTTGTHPPCPKAPVIIKSKATKEIAEVNTNYLCISSPLDYLKSTSYYQDFVNPGQKSLFSDPDFDTSFCDFNPITNIYECESSDPMSDIMSYNLTRCSWDDSYTPAPTPVYNDTTDTCHNSIIDVFYNFTWKGGDILVLNATYILADLPTELERVDNYPVTYTDFDSYDYSDDGNLTTTVPTVSSTESSIVPPDMDYGLVESISTVDVIVTKFPAVLSQKIRVVFWQEYTLPNVTQDSESEVPQRAERYQRSGKMGYEEDLPVFSGAPVYNETSDTLIQMDISPPSQLALWQPGPTGLCAQAGRRVVDFGQDSSSSCALRLGLSDFHQNCNDLRKQILHHQNALMSSIYISRNGDPVLTNLNDWIQIIRENISHIFPVGDISMTTGQGGTTAATTNPGSTSGDNSTEATATTPTYNSTEAPPTDGGLLSDIIGRCDNLTSGIHVDIMYAQSGAVNSLPLYEIVGAKISYTVSEWQLTCMGSLGQACLGNTSETTNMTESVETFYLSSSVRFMLVPAQTPTPKTRFELRYEEERSVCKHDACWEELFYPVLSVFHGDSLHYTRAVAMTTSIFLLSYFYVTKPWW